MASDVQIIGDRYQLTGRIGSGGMGEVYRARDTVLNRTVAVKVLPSSRATSADVVERFRREAQSAARISHPNVVGVYDWGETDSTYYMVMEYVRGRNLREILASQGALPPRQALEIASGVAAALSAAHERGLVHRDVKPENVIIGIDGSVKVTDFGIARTLDASVSTGDVLGTVAYVAPEQVQGGQIDARTDIYSAGCLLFELLTGSPPYEGDAARVLYQHVNEQMGAPSAMNEKVSSQVDEIVLRATTTDPQSRYQSAAEMKAVLDDRLATAELAPELAELTYDLTTEVAPSTAETITHADIKRKRHYWRWVAIALAVLLLAGAVFAFGPIKVPAVGGLSAAQARAMLKGAGLSVRTESIFSETVTQGLAVRTKPPGGSGIRRGGGVVLFISKGPPTIDLPDLTGMTLAQAKQAILGAGATVGAVTTKHARADIGSVIEQDPNPGVVRRGQPVNLVTSLGPAKVMVPKVKGKSFDDAQATLKDAGLTVTRADVFDDSPAGTVISQNPSAGTQVDEGSTVNLTVSKGPEPFSMPDVRGHKCSDAKKQLEALGLRVVVKSSSGKPTGCSSDRIAAQDPVPDATVHKGDEATLYILT